MRKMKEKYRKEVEVQENEANMMYAKESEALLESTNVRKTLEVKKRQRGDTKK